MGPSSHTPTVEEALELLYESSKLNPGPWLAHSLHVGQAGHIIARACGMDAQRGHALGLLHDIGRRFGVHGQRHGYDGYQYMMQLGYPAVAKICLTHCNIRRVPDPGGRSWDCTMDEMLFIRAFFRRAVYDDWDRLVQLCDAVADAQGFVLVEKRLMDVALRRGVSFQTLQDWEEQLKLIDYFSEKAGQNIYKLLPDIAQNTFGF
ncbi:MAG: HD domain-containing protein [Eubacteriales bacterium]|nr:HD domain-containing protein [Eubacteriales bacterium]